MGSTAKGPAARSSAGEENTLAGVLERASAARKEITEDIPVIGEVTLRPMLRSEHTDLPITAESSEDDDLLHIVAATVSAPAFSAEEWAQVRDAAPLGVWGTLTIAVMRANGLTADFVKAEGARFREG